MGRVESKDDYRILGICQLCSKAILSKDVYAMIKDMGNIYICERCISKIVSGTVNERPRTSNDR